MFEAAIGYMHMICQIIRWVFYRLFTRYHSDSMTCLVGKTAIVTGGNSGIGYAISTLLASRGCRVIIADVADSEKSRNSIIEKTSNKNVTTKYLNLSSLTSVRKFAEEISKEEGKIDILVNNAGIGISTIKSTEDGLNIMMQINIFGSFLLTHLLIKPLKASKAAKVVFTGSGLAFLSKLTLDNMNDTYNPLEFEYDWKMGLMLYENSKLCNILVAQEFAEKLRSYNIIVNSADPGMVGTGMFYLAIEYVHGFIGEIIRNLKLLYLATYLFGESTFEGAQTSFHLASSEKLNQTGQHFYRCREFGKPKILEDKKFCNEIWKRTEELVKLRPEEKL